MCLTVKGELRAIALVSAPQRAHLSRQGEPIVLTTRPRRAAVLGAITAALVLAACGSDNDAADTTTAATPTTAASSTPPSTAPSTDDATASSASAPGTTGAAADAASAAACAAGQTSQDGQLTIATGDPAFPPYVIDDDPASGEGFEAAVALAVAREMGFTGDAVRWVRTSFDSAVAGSDATFDFNIQQFSINPEREQVVSFSRPYYTANQAVLGYTDGPAKDVSTLSDLKELKLGAAAATTSLQFITDVIQPTEEPFAFNSNADAKTALDNGQIDAIITDLPTGLFIAAVEIEGTKVFGQFPVDAGGAGDEWGLLFPKDAPLVRCADLALATLESSGELAEITEEWMGEYSDAPTLAQG
jgi:polar amino acid transport system substrate-binding protein